MSEDLRDLQDCVSQLTPVIVLPEKCKCCRNWVCAKKRVAGPQRRSISMWAGGLSASCGGGGGAAVRSNLSPRPVLLFACPHKVSSAQSWFQEKGFARVRITARLPCEMKREKVTGRPYGHGIEMMQRSIGSTLFVGKVRQT